MEKWQSYVRKTETLDNLKTPQGDVVQKSLSFIDYWNFMSFKKCCIFNNSGKVIETISLTIIDVKSFVQK